jgi:hypothetical protein
MPPSFFALDTNVNFNVYDAYSDEASDSSARANASELWGDDNYAMFDRAGVSYDDDGTGDVCMGAFSKKWTWRATAVPVVHVRLDVVRARQEKERRDSRSAALWAVMRPHGAFGDISPVAHKTLMTMR